jgi:hypothetical protein
MSDKRLLFVEHLNTTFGRGEPPTLSWIVEATLEEEKKISAWLEKNFEHDQPYVGEITVLSFDEFADNVDMYVDEEDDDDDGPADPAG